MNDLPISHLLSSHGFESQGAERALETLRWKGLTRSGKTRIAVAKIKAVDRALGSAFVQHCRNPACRAPLGEGREAMLASATRCKSCDGSDNRREVERMPTSMARRGSMKLLVAGGSPRTRGELERMCANRLNLRFVTEETAPYGKTVGLLLNRSDLVAVGTSTEVSHKATAVLRGPKVLNVPRRGVAALAKAVRERRTAAA